jgi:hypothetical protein
VSFCGYLLRKYPDISWADFEGLCHARWQQFDQSKELWEWDDVRKNVVADCWERFSRGMPFDAWVRTQEPFGGITKPKQRPFTGHIGTATARTYVAAGR